MPQTPDSPAREMAAWTREKLGEDRLAWLRALPLRQAHDSVALVHASPSSAWRAPAPEAADAELESVYSPLGRPVAAYGHIHRPYLRGVAGFTVANCGSVSLSYPSRSTSYSTRRICGLALEGADGERVAACRMDRPDPPRRRSTDAVSW